MRNFQILIVYSVKICKQCLQTASVSGGLCPADHLQGIRPWTPLGIPVFQAPRATAPNKNSLRRRYAARASQVCMRLTSESTALLVTLAVQRYLQHPPEQHPQSLDLIVLHTERCCVRRRCD